MTSKVTPPNDVGPKVDELRYREVLADQRCPVCGGLHDMDQYPRRFREAGHRMIDAGMVRRARDLSGWSSQPSAPRNISGDTEDGDSE